jgi:membrane protein
VRRRLASLARLAQPILGRPVVVEVRRAWADFSHSGGTILAAGLAYRTLFATLTLLVFVAGLVGIVIHDPPRRVEVIDALVAVLPGPLHESLTSSVDALGQQGLTIGLIGLIGLFWGASSMYDAIDQATLVIIPGGRRRGGIDRRVRGLVALAALTVVSGVFLALTPLLVAGVLDVGGGALLATVIEPAVAVVAFVALAYAGYRFVPTEPPSAGQALAPAIVAGTAMSLLTTFFAVLAPYLVSRLAAFGILASFLGALIWLYLLSICFLVGGAWSRARRDGHARADQTV